MSTLKKITGKLLALGVRLHLQSISLHVRSFERKAEASTARSEQAEADLRLARTAYHAAIEAETVVHTECVAVQAAAREEAASLPNVSGYGRVRPAPPLGAKPVVIYKRK